MTQLTRHFTAGPTTAPACTKLATWQRAPVGPNLNTHKPLSTSPPARTQCTPDAFLSMTVFAARLLTVPAPAASRMALLSDTQVASAPPPPLQNPDPRSNANRQCSHLSPVLANVTTCESQKSQLCSELHTQQSPTIPSG